MKRDDSLANGKPHVQLDFPVVACCRGYENCRTSLKIPRAICADCESYWNRFF